jgi:hypothetical protein
MMRRIDLIKNMKPEEIAKEIIKLDITDAFCKGDCGEEDGCPHDVDCCIKWLEEEV